MVAVAEDSTLKSSDFSSDSKLELELDTGFGLSVAAGKKFGNGWRGEVEYAYQHMGVGRGKLAIGDSDKAAIGTFQGVDLSGVDSSNLDLGPLDEVIEDPDLHFFMVSGVYDIANNSPFTPYLGAGMGLGWEEEAEGTEFAYQFLAGITYEVSSRNELIFGYRYRGMTDLDYKIDDTDIKYTATADTHNFELGFRHSF